MNAHLAHELAMLGQLTVSSLRARYAQPRTSIMMDSPI